MRKMIFAIDFSNLGVILILNVNGAFATFFSN